MRNSCRDLILSNWDYLGAGGVKIGDFILNENHQDLTHNIIKNNNIIQSGFFGSPSAVGTTLVLYE